MYRFGFLLTVFTVIKYANGDECSCKWYFKHGPTIKHSLKGKEFLEETYHFMLQDQERWIQPYNHQKQFFVVPGGACPKDWTHAWEDDNGVTYSAKNHKVDLNYWWKWPYGMLNVELKSDLNNPMDKKYFGRVKNALGIGLYELGKQYNYTLAFETETPNYFSVVKQNLKIKT